MEETPLRSVQLLESIFNKLDTKAAEIDTTELEKYFEENTSMRFNTQQDVHEMLDVLMRSVSEQNGEYIPGSEKSVSAGKIRFDVTNYRNSTYEKIILKKIKVPLFVSGKRDERGMLDTRTRVCLVSYNISRYFCHFPTLRTSDSHTNSLVHFYIFYVKYRNCTY